MLATVSLRAAARAARPLVGGRGRVPTSAGCRCAPLGPLGPLIAPPADRAVRLRHSSPRPPQRSHPAPHHGKHPGHRGKTALFDIKHERLRLVDADGKQVGVMDRLDALEECIRKGMLMVEVNARSDPPICRMTSPLAYAQDIERASKPSHEPVDLKPAKELRLKTAIEEHDLDIKARNARRILSKQHPLRLSVQPGPAHKPDRDRVNGSNAAFQEAATQLHERFTPLVADIASTGGLRMTGWASAQALYTPRSDSVDEGQLDEKHREKKAAKKAAKDAAKPHVSDAAANSADADRISEASRSVLLKLVERARSGVVVHNRQIPREANPFIPVR